MYSRDDADTFNILRCVQTLHKVKYPHDKLVVTLNRELLKQGPRHVKVDPALEGWEGFSSWKVRLASAITKEVVLEGGCN